MLKKLDFVNEKLHNPIFLFIFAQNQKSLIQKQTKMKRIYSILSILMCFVSSIFAEEVVNNDVIIGDSAADNVTVEEIQESNVVKDIKRTQTAYKTKKINPMVFGYVWNGQEFD